MKETTKTKTIPTQLFQEGTQKFAIYVEKKDIFNSSALSEKREIDCNYYKITNIHLVHVNLKMWLVN